MNQLLEVVRTTINELLDNKSTTEATKSRTGRKFLREMPTRKDKTPSDRERIDGQIFLSYIHEASKKKYPGLKDYYFEIDLDRVGWGGDGIYWDVQNVQPVGLRRGDRDPSELWLTKYEDGEAYDYRPVKLFGKSPEQVWSEVVKEFESGEGLRDWS